jgi:Glycosyl transferase family 2
VSESSTVPRIEATYLLPLRTEDDVDELAGYLGDVAGWVDEVVVVDGSSSGAIIAHAAAFGPEVTTVEPDERTLNGKVGGVMTGLHRASHERVVIADDDVRYTRAQLERVVAMLDGAAVVRPQNYFAPLPWHARLDTARTLLNRTMGGDWPGTLAVRRSVVLDAGGYASDVLFENLELVRTISAAGGREALALDVLIRRTPPTTRDFRRQQVRQAYDEFARPWRFVASLLVLPAIAWTIARRRRATLLAAALSSIALAETGRRRLGGRDVFPASSSLLAAPWLAWRSACSWLALGARARGGARYRGTRILRAATPVRDLVAARSITSSSGPGV